MRQMAGDHRKASEIIDLRMSVWLRLRQKKEDLEPERVMLGTRLKAYYGEVCRKESEEAEILTESLCVTRERIAALKGREAGYQKAPQEAERLAGGLQTRISGYDGEEERYNRRHRQSLRRNILGEDEPAALEMAADGLIRERSKSAAL